MQSWNKKLFTSGLRRAGDLQVGGRGAQRGDGGEQGRLRQLLRARGHAGGRGGQGRHPVQGEAGGHLLLRVRGQYQHLGIYVMQCIEDTYQCRLFAGRWSL